MAFRGKLNAWLVPTTARDEWLTLAVRLDELPDAAVPCRADPEAWWPDRKRLDAPAKHGPVAACHR